MTAEDVAKRVNAASPAVAPFPTRVKPRVDLREQPCPVLFLGIEGGRLCYLSPAGEIVTLKPNEHQKNQIGYLFGVEIDWLWEAFPSYGKASDDAEPPIIGWNAQHASEWLKVQCTAAGFVDLSRSVRGPGVWRTDAGELLLHAGDALYLAAEGSWLPAGRWLDGYVYPSRPPEPRPDFTAPAPVEVAGDLFRLVKRWTWEVDDRGGVRKSTDPRGDVGPRIWLGWTGLANICGAVPHRAVLRVTGGSGEGKTTLEELQEAMLGGERAIEKVSDPTAAYIRSALGGSARPVIVDESEPSPFHTRASEVLEVVRLAFSNRQAPVGRGAPDGKVRRDYLRAAVYLTSILKPKTLPQDRSRIIDLELGPLPEDTEGKNTAEVLAEKDRLAGLAPQLRARMFLGWGRFRENLMIFERAFSGAGAVRRHVDKMAPVLAAAETLLSDEVVASERAAEIVREVSVLAETDPVIVEHEECLAHMLSTQVDPYRHGDRKSLGEWIELSMRDADGLQAREMLPRQGIRLHPNNGSWTHVLIANNHQGLEFIYRETRWTGGVWASALGRFAGAMKSPADIKELMRIAPMQRFGGSMPTRFTALPRELFKDPPTPAREDPGEDGKPDTGDPSPSPPPPNPP